MRRREDERSVSPFCVPHTSKCRNKEVADSEAQAPSWLMQQLNPKDKALDEWILYQNDLWQMGKMHLTAKVEQVFILVSCNLSYQIEKL